MLLHDPFGALQFAIRPLVGLLYKPMSEEPSVADLKTPYPNLESLKLVNLSCHMLELLSVEDFSSLSHASKQGVQLPLIGFV
jgi:hypothetical protein